MAVYPLSLQRFTSLRKGKIDLHTAFVQPEDGFVLKVTIPKSDAGQAQVELIPHDQLDESWAPLGEDYLDLSTLPRVVWENVDQRTGNRREPNLSIAASPLLTAV
jgi:hypothetical protein